MDLIKRISSGTCGCGNAPSYFFGHFLMCDKCQPFHVTNFIMSPTRVYRYMYLPTLHVRDAATTFGVPTSNMSSILSYVHNGSRVCLLRPFRRTGRTVHPTNCLRQGCGTPIANKLYCSVLCYLAVTKPDVDVEENDDVLGARNVTHPPLVSTTRRPVNTTMITIHQELQTKRKHTNKMRSASVSSNLAAPKSPKSPICCNTPTSGLVSVRKRIRKNRFPSPSPSE